MIDFEKVNREEVLYELVNGSDIFAFVLKIDSRKAVTYGCYRLKDEKIRSIKSLVIQNNVVFYKKKEESV